MLSVPTLTGTHVTPCILRHNPAKNELKVDIRNFQCIHASGFLGSISNFSV